MFLVMGFTYAGGSFGEYASTTNLCHCLLLNSTNPTGTWTLVSTYNAPVSFYITGISGIRTSVLNGTIAPDSIYPITVTATNFSKNVTGNLFAYLNDTNSIGTNLQLAVSKAIEIQALPSPPATTSVSPTVVITSTGGVTGGTENITSVVSITANTIALPNLTIDTSKSFILLNQQMNLTINFITPTYAGVTINGQRYNLTIGVPVKIDPVNYTYYAEATNITWTPVLPSVTLLIWGNENTPLANNTSKCGNIPSDKCYPPRTSTTSTIPPKSSSIVSSTPNTTISNSTNSRTSSNGSHLSIILIGVVIMIAFIGCIVLIFLRDRIFGK